MRPWPRVTHCTSWVGTHRWPPLARCVPTLRRGVRGAHRGRPGTLLASAPRVCPDAPRVEGVRGCAREAAPPGRARRRSRARRRPRSRSCAASRESSLAGRVGRREPRARSASAGRWSACGVAAWARRPASRFGPAARGGRRAWLLVELNNPGVGSSLAVHARPAWATRRAPALVAHAALAYPEGRVPGGARACCARARLRRRAARARPAAHARSSTPRRRAARDCPGNLLAITSAPGRRRGGRPRRRWSSASSGRSRWPCSRSCEVARSSPAARRLRAPVLLAGRRLPRAGRRRLRARLSTAASSPTTPSTRRCGSAQAAALVAARARRRAGVGARAAGAHGAWRGS